MDPFDDLLRGVRAVGTGFSRTELSPPWALRFGDAESLTLLAPLPGEGWISFGDGGKARLVRAGDTAIARGPGPFAISDRPEPGRAASADQAVLLTATYRVRGGVAHDAGRPVRRAGGRAAADVPDVLADDLGRRPAGRIHRPRSPR
ncbi:cupin domain-containing protein [Saccharopolyspora sp. 5N102]|uniref:cupin domain-containing protein n=1 Tax=Saccharopolyspora sp. 5N102 TaxID=3375155 RepID=UPI0037A2CCD3